MSFKNKRFLTVFILSISILSLTSCKEDTKSIEPVKVSFKKEGELILKKSSNDSIIAQLNIEIADTEYETQTGLMYRNSMNANDAMLFVFSNQIPRSFYMKNTRIPLDIIYLDDTNTVVSFQENAKPFDESSLPSGVPAKYVLEVNAGLVKQWLLGVGDKMEFSSIE